MLHSFYAGLLSRWRNVAAVIAVIVSTCNIQAQLPLDSRGMEPDPVIANMTIPVTTNAVSCVPSIADMQVAGNVRMLAPDELRQKQPKSMPGFSKSPLLAGTTRDFTGSWI
ncbi:MAG: hypothetical protein K2M98_02820, partial [Muribaculum sp.]|nr:hypothetical protein [Muribaculum sp.]